MNLRKSIASTLLAGTVLLSAVMTGAAQSSMQAEVVITGGALTAQVVEYDFDDTNFSFQQQTMSGNAGFQVHDLRGNYGGWDVTITGLTDLKGHYSNYEIDINSATILTSNHYANQIVGTPGQTLSSDVLPPNASGFPGVHGNNSAANLGVPGSTGQYEFGFNMDLTVPAGAPADYYYSTVTIDVTGGGQP